MTPDTSSVRGPEWARGCKDCQFGLVNAPEITPRTVSMLELRTVQAGDGMLVFCTCRAGLLYRQFLRKQYALMNSQVCDVIRQHIAAGTVVPSIHYEPA